MLTSNQVSWLGPGKCFEHLLGSIIYSIIYFMVSIVDIKKGPGRPRKDSEAVMVRMPSETLHKVDAFVQREKDTPSRPEAIRRLVELGLKAKR
jgi:hypothetical protein